jgi:peptide/nickel transport system permease protein
MLLRFFLTKLLRLLITVLAAVTLVFVVLRSAGDPLVSLLPPDLPDSVIAVYRARFGLDVPIWRQYLNYLASVLAGDFGFSFRTNGPAVNLVLERLPATLALGGVALSISIGLGVPLGITAALYRDRLLDRAVMSLAVFGLAMPNFFIGILLILLFTLSLNWLPSSGNGSALHFIMPSITLGLAVTGTFARFTRSAVLEVLGANFMRTAAAKGIGLARRIVHHALPNAAIPLLTLLGFTIGAMIGGAVVTETVFAWPGVGRLLIVSVGERDLAVVQLIVLMIAVSMSLTNLLVDMAYVLVDPRIRIAASAGDAGPPS